MEAEGKTWNYHDILAQFITMHNKKSNVLLIWSGDWPTYSSNSDKYYVILAGEGFDSTDEAWNWCKANNYGPNDCMSIDLRPFAVWCGWVCQVVTVLRSSLPQVR